jgi:hypothetical protein
MARALLRRPITGSYTTGGRRSQPGPVPKRSEGSSRRPRPVHHHFRPTVECLEPRWTPAISLAAQQTFAVGFNASSVAVADFNTDGRPDFAATNTGDNTVSVLLNATGPGSATAAFTTQKTLFVQSGPVPIASGDFNGDGRPDLVVVNTVSSSASVLLNTTAPGAATPTFAGQQTFTTGFEPAGVAVGDLNGDGRPDIIVANGGSSTVSVLLNTTAAGAVTASFAAQQTFAVGSSPFGVAAADLNGDGKPDLVTANFNSNTVSVLLNTTAPGAAVPSFGAQQTFAAGNEPYGVAVGDVNGDGRLDLAVANFNSTNVSVYLNTTALGAMSASFAAQQSFAAGTRPISATFADLDGDGKPDLAVANFNSNTLSVYANTTAAGAAVASFGAQQTFATGGSPRGVAAADFNTDGRPDLVTASFDDKTASVFLNTTIPVPSAVPVVVGQFGSQGVWEYNRFLSTWVQLTAANASLLAADSLGDVVGEFPGFGVWLFRPAFSWAQINGIDATILTMNANGAVAAEFPGFGVGEFVPAFGWRLLTGANASLLSIDDNSAVAGEFQGFGVWLFRPASGWSQINGVDASLLALSPRGDVVANFHGFGVGEFSLATGWHLLNGTEATALAVDRYGDVTATFAGIGVGRYYPTQGWQLLTGANASLLRYDSLNDVIGEFPGFGAWEFDAFRGWFQLTGADATILATG